jgi:hypothetical protein
MKKYHIFKSPYILIEDINNKHQPYHKEYSSVDPPRLNLSSPPLCCPFLENKKFRSTKKNRAVKQGFCEICYLKYKDYDQHVNEQEHREFAVDNMNYKEVDEIIDSIGGWGDPSFCEDSEGKPASPLMRKTPGSSIHENGGVSVIECDYTKESINTLVFSRMSDCDVSGEEYLEKLVPDVDSFINTFLSKE